MDNSDGIWRLAVCIYLSSLCTALIILSLHETYAKRLYEESEWSLYLVVVGLVCSIVQMRVMFEREAVYLRLGLLTFFTSSVWLLVMIYSWLLSDTSDPLMNAPTSVSISCIIFIIVIFLIASVLEYAYSDHNNNSFDAFTLPTAQAHIQGVLNNLLFAAISLLVCWGTLLVINDENAWDWNYMRGMCVSILVLWYLLLYASCGVNESWSREQQTAAVILWPFLGVLAV